MVGAGKKPLLAPTPRRYDAVHTHLSGEILPVDVQLIRPETKLDVTHLIEQTRPENTRDARGVQSW